MLTIFYLQVDPLLRTEHAPSLSLFSPNMALDTASDVGPPVYTLFPARTVTDAWREWKEGIGGRPALEELEEKWGARWRPEAAQRTAFCRRKVVLDELHRLQKAGRSPEDAVAELEALRAGRSLGKLAVDLMARRQQRKDRQRVQG